MSDLSFVSGSAPSEDDYEDDRRYDDDHGDDLDEDVLHADQDHEDSASFPDDDQEVASEAEDNVQGGQDLDISKIVLCSKHKSGEMIPDSCRSCKAGLRLFKDKDTIKKLTNNNEGGSGILSRYMGRCDTAAPTLALSPDTIQLALGIFTKGVFKESKMWMEIVKQFLMLPIEQHEQLNADIEIEDFLSKFRKEKRFQNLFRYGSDLVKCLKNLRTSQ